MSEWQTIDSAPADGEYIIVFGGRHLKPTVMRADGGWWRDSRRNHNSQSVPTHWMPLPPPPLPSDEERSDTGSPQERGQPDIEGQAA